MVPILPFIASLMNIACRAQMRISRRRTSRKMPDVTAAPPQRVYSTGMTIALAGVLMFFMALVSAYIVRKGFPNSDWSSVSIPHILWLNTLILVASSFTLERSRKLFAEEREGDFRHFWNITIILGLFFLAGQAIAWW